MVFENQPRTQKVACWIGFLNFSQVKKEKKEHLSIINENATITGSLFNKLNFQKSMKAAFKIAFI